MAQSLLVAICGGSGSGKSTITRFVRGAFHEGVVEVIEEDNYYKDLSGEPEEVRRSVNWDSPDSKDFEALRQDLSGLKTGKTLLKRKYDFSRDGPGDELVVTKPAPLVVVEGILSLADPPTRQLFDVRVFIEADEAVRYARRLARDTKERGRTPQSVESQWRSSVQPMCLLHIEPYRSFADFVVSNNAVDGYKEATGPLIQELGRRASVVPMLNY
jgi:uridine kinase